MDENRRTWNALEDAHVNKTNTDLFKQFVLLIKINIETYKNNIEFFCIKIIIKLKKKWAILNTCACLHLLHITNKSTTRPKSSVASKNFEIYCYFFNLNDFLMQERTYQYVKH